MSVTLDLGLWSKDIQQWAAFCWAFYSWSIFLAMCGSHTAVVYLRPALAKVMQARWLGSCWHPLMMRFMNPLDFDWLWSRVCIHGPPGQVVRQDPPMYLSFSVAIRITQHS